MLENFLRPYVELHPSTWSQRLTIAEFTANNAENASTGFTHFYLKGGQNPLISNILLGTTIPANNQVVTNIMERLKKALGDAKTNLTTA